MSSIPATAAPPPAFFFNDTATTEIYTLSLHDALPISGRRLRVRRVVGPGESPDDGPAFRAAARGRGAPPERAGAVRARPVRGRGPEPPHRDPVRHAQRLARAVRLQHVPAPHVVRPRGLRAVLAGLARARAARLPRGPP